MSHSHRVYRGRMADLSSGISDENGVVRRHLIRIDPEQGRPVALRELIVGPELDLALGPEVH